MPSCASIEISSCLIPGRSKAYTSSLSVSQASSVGTQACVWRPLPSKSPFISRDSSFCIAVISRIGAQLPVFQRTSVVIVHSSFRFVLYRGA